MFSDPHFESLVSPPPPHFQSSSAGPEVAKTRVGDEVRISKYKGIVFSKGFEPNVTEELFVVAKI